jgi:RNA polymerase sigma-70 factor (ECF subfamily)
MERVQAGDERALGELLERYRSRLFAFLSRRSGDPDSADDLFQETWIRVARARDSFDPKRSFSTWLFQIANNLCRDLFRRREVETRAKRTLREAAQSDPRARTAPRLDAKLDVERRLAQLPDRLRAVLVLRYFHGFGEREMAEILEIPQGTVKSRLHHAVRILRGMDEPSEQSAEGGARGVS